MTQMDRFQEMQIFVRIMERRSFTQAAEDLLIPRATVSNALKRLEARLGTRLFERTTRAVVPTLDGEAYYERCTRLLADLEDADGAFRNSTPRGLLRVNLQSTLAKRFVVPKMPQFLNRYPGIELHIGEGDRLVDLVREGIDCVLRAGNLQDSSMVARRITELEQVTCASPDYLEEHGEPSRLEDLQRHTAVNYISSMTGKPYPLEFRTPAGTIPITLLSRLSVAGTDIYSGSAIAGIGIIQVPRYRIERELREGQLKVILPDFPPPSLPVSVLYPQSRQLSPRVRVFAEWLKECFTAPFADVHGHAL